MKNYSLLNLLFICVALFTFSSCGEDDTPPGTDAFGPTLTLSDEAGFISFDETIAPGETINVRVIASEGDSPMNTFTVVENSFNMELERLEFDGAPASANPKLLFDTDKTSFEIDVAIVPHASGTSSYEFIAEDENGNTDIAYLDISIQEGTLSVSLSSGSNAITLESPSLVSIPLNVTPGGSILNTISVLEDGVAITDLTRLRYGDIAVQFDDNPQIIPVEDENGFSKTIYVSSHTTEGVTKTYTVVVEDASAETAMVDMTVTLEQTVIATPIDAEYTAILIWNADGPNGGGLDLDNGVNVSAFDGSADLIDSGIDGNGDWFRTIEPANGADLRLIDPANTDLYTYSNVTSKELLLEAYNTGSPISQSGTVELGDTFTARVGTSTFLFTVNNVVETTGDNLDYYEFNIKKAL